MCNANSSPETLLLAAGCPCVTMVVVCGHVQVAALRKQLASKGAEADSLSRRVGAVNSLTTAYEQVRAQPSHPCSRFQAVLGGLWPLSLLNMFCWQP